MSLKYETSIQLKNIRHCRYGKHHNINGPAVIWKAGGIEWWQYGYWIKPR